MRTYPLAFELIRKLFLGPPFLASIFETLQSHYFESA